ncbi:hypothetical protein H6F93_11240 [Leptolyngbya sp. FACHB-671]|uniref:hypothetical protein n=1 Tax=Leptolyngbya sp. FACHB-671 TaxID=2692812 RepID=UPI0016825619|nr:hypothetical protein [Leptolyngbya sp. FACHB-671]MBD2068091.1 hypothetical protein [Leptolyngbya sp. FACHB-671]
MTARGIHTRISGLKSRGDRYSDIQPGHLSPSYLMSAMNPRWRQITIPIEVLVALIAALIVFLPMLHPLRVWTAGGVWCAQSVPDGGLKVLVEPRIATFQKLKPRNRSRAAK